MNVFLIFSLAKFRMLFNLIDRLYFRLIITDLVIILLSAFMMASWSWVWIFSFSSSFCRFKIFKIFKFSSNSFCFFNDSFNNRSSSSSFSLDSFCLNLFIFDHIGFYCSTQDNLPFPWLFLEVRNFFTNKII